MRGVPITVLALIGGHYLLSGLLLGWTGFGVGDRRHPPDPARTRRWLRQAGLHEVTAAQFVATAAGCSLLGAAVGAVLFGSPIPVLVAAVVGAATPWALHRQRRRTRRLRANESWPALIEEIRVLCGPVGLSIPQALFEVGERSPEAMRWAFRAAAREWRLSADFDNAVSQLKSDLADPTADLVLETLLVANQLGGSGVGDRLRDLADDRVRDMAGRRDAAARLAGARFARTFVLGVPLGMTLAGLSLGTGRAAYATPVGQVLVGTALAMIAGCWLWASWLMRIPPTSRVFDR